MHWHCGEVVKQRNLEVGGKIEGTENEGFWLDTDDVVANLTNEGELDHVRGSRFWKKITAIDEHGTNGYAFEGDLLPNNKGIKFVDLKPGDLVLAYDDYGSIKYHSPHVVIAEITSIDKENKNFNYKPIIRVVGWDWAQQILSDSDTMKLLKQILTMKQEAVNLATTTTTAPSNNEAPSNEEEAKKLISQAIALAGKDFVKKLLWGE